MRPNCFNLTFPSPRSTPIFAKRVRWPVSCSINSANSPINQVVFMAHPKLEELNKAAAKQSPFTFRRIQTRELYQPTNESDGTRVRFRVRVQILGRGAQQ